jgi:hypothetical protein
MLDQPSSRESKDCPHRILWSVAHEFAGQFRYLVRAAVNRLRCHPMIYPQYLGVTLWRTLWASWQSSSGHCPLPIPMRTGREACKAKFSLQAKWQHTALLCCVVVRVAGRAALGRFRNNLSLLQRPQSLPAGIPRTLSTGQWNLGRQHGKLARVFAYLPRPLARMMRQDLDPDVPKKLTLRHTRHLYHPHPIVHGCANSHATMAG